MKPPLLLLVAAKSLYRTRSGSFGHMTRAANVPPLKELGSIAQMCFVCKIDGNVIHIPRNGGICTCDLAAKKRRPPTAKPKVEKKPPKRMVALLTRSK